MIGLALLFAFLIALTGFALWADATGWDPFADLYGSTDPRELVERARESKPARIDWARMHHGVCPKCGEDKFIGHGPLCVDCIGGAA